MTVSYAWLKCIPILGFFNLSTDIRAKYDGPTCSNTWDKSTTLSKLSVVTWLPVESLHSHFLLTGQLLF